MVHAVIICSCCLAIASMAVAADAGQDADALFREGKRLLSKRDYAKACPLLEASFKLDPGTGVLLAKAICHEGEGKLASAFAAYDEVTKRANGEGRPDRAKVARERAAAIESKLSTLAIVAPPAASRGEGFTISRNGVVVDTQAPVPLDGGRYVIEAKANGKRAWTATIELASARDRQTITVPVLEDVPASPPALARAIAVRDDSIRVAPPVLLKTMDGSKPSGDGRGGIAAASIALGAVSAACLGVSGYYGWRAMRKNDESKDGCDGDVCDPAGRANRLAALSAGNSATVAFIAAAVTGAAAVTLLVLDRKTPSRRTDHSATIRGGLAFDPAGERVVLGLSLSQ